MIQKTNPSSLIHQLRFLPVHSIVSRYLGVRTKSNLNTLSPQLGFVMIHLIISRYIRIGTKSISPLFDHNNIILETMIDLNHIILTDLRLKQYIFKKYRIFTNT